MAEPIIIKDAEIYDYKNGINGERRDILVESGKIVDNLEDRNSQNEINADGLVAFPGFIDMRTQIFSPATNWCRVKALNEDNFVQIPSVGEIQSVLLSRGFTTVAEMDVPMTQSKSTLYNMSRAPLLDKMMVMDFGSNWTFFSDLEADGYIKKIAVVMSYLMSLVKGYGISINAPYHQQFWKLSEEIPRSPESVPVFNLPIDKVYRKFVKASRAGKFRSSLFLSPYDMETPEIIGPLSDLFRKLSALKSDSGNTAHLHLSQLNHFFFEDPNAAVDLLKAENVTGDVNPVKFGLNRPLITRDRNLAIRESKKSGVPITTIDLEFDTEYYITTRKWESADDTGVNLWSSAVGILLESKQQDQIDSVVLSSNMPYNMCPVDWGEVMASLMNKKYRSSIFKEFNEQSNSYTSIIEGGVTLDLLDLSAILSANPAKALGLGDFKGHLGTGAVADVVLFSKESLENLINSSISDASGAEFSAHTVIKSGKIIMKDSTLDESLTESVGKIYWNKGSVKSERTEKIHEMKNSFFKKHFSMYINALDNTSDDLMEI